MKISEIAARSGVTVATIRYYERRGLIPEPPRTASGYRNYDAKAADRLRFIKQAQRLGFTLEEIQELLDMRVHPESACDDVKAQAQAKISRVSIKIQELEAIKQVLERLVTSCELRRETNDCPILEVLDGGEDA